jgi:hypothetical protein
MTLNPIAFLYLLKKCRRNFVVMRVLIISCLLTIQPAVAEKYFTWVDAQGRVHNQLIPDEKLITETDEKDKVDQVKDSKLNSDSASLQGPDSAKDSSEDFIDSDQLEAQGFNRIKNERPFYVWVDATGQTRQTFYPSQTEVSSSGSQAAGNDSAKLKAKRFDGVPFVLNKCCDFLKNAKAKKADYSDDTYVEFTNMSRSLPFSTGRSPMAFFSLPLASTINLKSFVLKSSLFNPAIVFLDKDFQQISGKQFMLTQQYQSSGFYRAFVSGDVEVPKNSRYFMVLTSNDLQQSSQLIGNDIINHQTTGELVIRVVK